MKNNNILEEKKQENREKNKLAAQRRRANLSEDQKREAREKAKLAMQERRANLSEDQKETIREIERIKRQKQRQTYSDEERSLLKAQDAMQHRRKYQEDKRVNNQLPQTIQSDNTDDNKVGEERLDYSNGIEGESEVDEDEDEVNPLTDWKLYRERRNAQSRISKRARYARLKEAEAQLKEMTTVGENCAIISGDDNDDIQQLQLLANKRQQILENHRQYAQTYRQNHQQQHRRWVRIQQAWDEDNPCR